MLNLLRLHHAHVQVTDLSANARFATNFGLVEEARTAGKTYWRTSGGDAYSYVVESGATNRFVGLAFLAESRLELEKAVRDFGATPIRKLDAPAGGESATLTDPDGNLVHIVYGIEERKADALRPQIRVNYPGSPVRFNESQGARVAGPCQLLRLGHVGLYVGDFSRTADWYQRVLGLIPSDRMYAGQPGHFVGGFYRLNRGAEFVDHHVLAFFAMGKSGLHHMSFEVSDFEQQMAAHRHLKKQTFQSVWGVGRHPLGSHVFDVWKDPNGLRFETFSDTDLCNDQRCRFDHPIQNSELDLWRDQGPDAYFS